MAVADDPTLAFLRDLDDPSKYAVRRGVPIGRAFARKLPDGTDLTVAEAELPEIAENTAAAESDSGVVMRLTVGHVKPGQSQEDQPRLVGFARKARFGTFGPNAVPSVLADTYTLREFEDSAESGQYPFRSMEYRIDKRRITGVALLKTDPYLDLGVVMFGADTALVAFKEDGMGEPGQQPPPAAGNPPPAAAGPVQMTPEDKQKADALMSYFMQANPWMAKCAAEFGVEKPDATDGDGKPVEKPEDMPNDKGDDVDKDPTAKMQADLAARDARIAALEKKNDESAVDAMLARMEAAHVDFDAKHEKDTLLSFAADKREPYLANAIKRYPKKPVGDMIRTYGGHVEGGGGKKELSREQMDTALAMMEADKTLTVAAARERVLKG